MTNKVLEFKWTVSRDRDTYGYNICSLYVDGKKVASCNDGGSYDMAGASLGNWIAHEYRDRLMKLKPEEMPEQAHWERSSNPRRVCPNYDCPVIHKKMVDYIKFHLPSDMEKCPHCGAETKIDWNDGKRVLDGHYLYGLTYHDPNLDPGKAVVGEGCDDRTLGKGSEGKTVEQAEKDGERYQAFYRASSKHPSERHTVPLIDGACGFEVVKRIMEAIGLTLEYVFPPKGKRPKEKRRDNTYILHDERMKEAATEMVMKDVAN
jgi:hypothetical protein